MSAYATEKAVAIAAVTAAAKLCQYVRKNTLENAMEKDDKSPVTIADYGAQAVVCKALLESFPTDPVVAEEDAGNLCGRNLERVTECVQTVESQANHEDIPRWINHGNGTVSQRYWTLDPIDGTKGFLRGDQYAVALALVADGQVQVGVMACPALEEAGALFVAVRGQGATMQRLSTHDGNVSTSSSPPSIRVSNENPRMVESWESAHSNQPLQKAIAAATGMTTDSIRMDSQAKYGIVASGQAALYLCLPNPGKPHYKENIWDHAAGCLVVEEAGGTVTDMHGNCLDFTQGEKLMGTGVVVSNGDIHFKVLQALQQHLDGKAPDK
ncbi:3'(2'),5'-bisphosphate nucleotidase [Seminavis robusta]|uniref:3'(2'),5'-bisphosphate nucleotidase n=1 Tax=Seminavis robusta TaxID=568900 RepID=A0A9N8HQ43_9STRA|nr:3'(2'),5'-bisphosphate nucleotidase [Seminavis robusta]|eukprot:Sro1398_g269310.1 3'(2'),5'-bisphosphate nucleotidase (326) ;mRNA; r:26009-26986